MKKALVTGGAGFIGRWLVKKLLDEHIEVWVLDNLDNGQESNLDEFRGNPYLKAVVIDDIRNTKVLETLFKTRFDMVYHLAAQINVHESLENPQKSFSVNVEGTFNILEACKPNKTKLLLMGTCMVYDLAESKKAIAEDHPLKPVSPYAGSKLAAEQLAESYYYSYGLPIVICRPFNTYGPFQKHNLEGGVISIFVKQAKEKQPIKIFGDGTQTRDFLYVEDCVEFLYTASTNENALGQVINAGLGRDFTIYYLAKMICSDPEKIQFIEHHHPQSEIKKLLCDSSKAKHLLGWEPKTDLTAGIEQIRQWLQNPYVSA